MVTANETLHAEIAQRQRVERELRLLLTVTQEIADAADFLSSVDTALRRISESTGWALAEAWIPSRDGTALECRCVWHEKSKPLERFEEQSNDFRFSPGLGLPGRVWVAKRPEWVRDISMTDSPRAQIVTEARLKGALGVPVIADDQVLCVLVFFMRQEFEEDNHLVELLSAIANQLGAAIKHKQTEQALRQARAELEMRVRDRTVEVAQANQALQAEIAQRRRTQEEMNSRARQQGVVAKIGQLALSGGELSALLEEACALVAGTLGIELCKVLEFLADGQTLRLRAGVGWKEGLIGTATVSAGCNSQAGYTVMSGAPVVVEDLRTETRFNGPPLLHEHGVVSGMCVIISGRAQPFGVLGAHTTKQRSFGADDVHFLEAVANVLSEAIERKRAEEALRRSASWLSGLVETTQDGVVSIDRQGRIVLFNPAAEKIFGYGRPEVVGKKVNILMAEPYASEHDDYIERYERTGVPHAIGRIRTVTAKRKDGELFPIELSVTKIAEDRDVQYAAFIRDISEKERLQAQLMESERLAAIGTTAAKIGHELGNPLNGMSLTVQLLEQRLSRYQSALDSHVSATVKRLKDEISRLNQLAGQFRTIARREIYNFRPTSLADLVGEVIKIQSPHFEVAGIQVNNVLPSDLPRMSLDGDKIKQALLNLTKNAAEAMPNGGKLTIEARSTADGIQLDITDTGIGIPLDIDAFEPFVTTKKDGTGVGLVIVRQIVVAHGGNISYNTRPGEGTTFRIELPRR